MSDGLVVFSLDRIGIKGDYLVGVKQELQDQGKALISVEDHIDDTPIIPIRARGKTANRVNNQSSNSIRVGRSPYGYRVFDGTIIEFPYEQSVIKYIKKLYFYEGFKSSEIACKLNELKIQAKGKKGWNPKTVQRIIFIEPKIVVKLRDSGQLLPSSKWKEVQSQMQDLADAEIPKELIG